MISFLKYFSFVSPWEKQLYFPEASAPYIQKSSREWNRHGAVVVRQKHRLLFGTKKNIKP